MTIFTIGHTIKVGLYLFYVWGVISIQFKPVALEDKPVLDGFLRQAGLECSEYTFTNLYMWRKAFAVSWAVEGSYLWLSMTWQGRTFLLFPVGPLTEELEPALRQAEQFFQEQNAPFLMKGAPKEGIAAVNEFAPGRYVMTEDRDNFDYVYLAQDLIELKGRQFKSKKNHLNGFLRDYPDYEYEELHPELIPEYVEFTGQWFQQHHGVIDEVLAFERQAIVDIVSNYEYLGVKGGVIRTGRQIVALSLGEWLNSEMAVIHIEKANADIRGSYQIINRDFCRYAWSEATYINREEDMGIPGMRKAKLSYRPVRMVEKYDIRPAE